METNRKLMQYMRKLLGPFFSLLTGYSGCEPLTPGDIAEVIVFAAGRRENVVLADSLIFPNHQVRSFPLDLFLSRISKVIMPGRCNYHAQKVIG